MSNRLLLITYAFAPLSAPEAILNSKLPDLLPDYEIDVVTIDHESLKLSLDASLGAMVEGKFGAVHRVKPAFWCTPFVFKFLRYFCVFPDRYTVFNGNVVKKALALGLNNYDVIMTWSQWHSIHLVGLALKTENPDSFWVAHLSDPWSCNPFLPKYKIFRSLQKFFEKKTFAKADQLHFTSEETRKMSVRDYSCSVSAKAFTIPHAFKKRFLQPKNHKYDSDKIKIRYMGNFYGARNPITLIKIFQQLMRQDKQILKDVQIEFFGSWLGVQNPSNHVEKQFQDQIFFREPVDYKQSLQLMSDAEILLIIDAPSAESMFFPSKLVDYMSAERPIVAITPDGTAERIIRSIGGFVISPNSEQSVESGFMEAIVKYRKGKLFPPDKHKIGKYETEYVSKLYTEVLHSN